MPDFRVFPGDTRPAARAKLRPGSKAARTIAAAKARAQAPLFPKDFRPSGRRAGFPHPSLRYRTPATDARFAAFWSRF